MGGLNENSKTQSDKPKIRLAVDLGTTNSIGVMWRDGAAEIIPNRAGAKMTPSAVYHNGNVTLTGYAALARKEDEPYATAVQFKRYMGTEEKISLSEKDFTPEELSALILQSIVQDAQDYTGEKIDELVISVPAYFDERQRRATRKAGEMLGLPVIRLINEPSAAAIALRSDKDMEQFIVCDFGGGTLDISIVDCFDNVIAMSAICGNNRLGGMDIDMAIATEFARQMNTSFERYSEKEQMLMLKHAEEAKIMLARNISITHDMGDEFGDAKVVLSQTMLTELIAPLIEQLKQCVTRAVIDAQVGMDDLDRLVMVGGTSHVYSVQHTMEQMLRLPVETPLDADYLVAQGLGLYLGMMERDESMKDIVITDICPFSLSIAVGDDYKPGHFRSGFLIERNAVLPAMGKISIVTGSIGQSQALIRVAQGESIDFADNREIGNFLIEWETRWNERTIFELRFLYDLDAMLEVELVNVHTKEKFCYVLSENGKFERKDTLQKSATELRIMQVTQIMMEPFLQVKARAASLRQIVPVEKRNEIYRNCMNFEDNYEKAGSSLKKRSDVVEAYTSYLNGIEAELLAVDIFQNENEPFDVDGPIPTDDGGWH